MGCVKPEHDNTTDIGVCQGCLTDAEAERDRYKAALEKIAGRCECIDGSKCDGCVAEAALRGTEKQ